MESPEEFVKRFPWMSLNGEPDLKQWAKAMTQNTGRLVLGNE